MENVSNKIGFIMMLFVVTFLQTIYAQPLRLIPSLDQTKNYKQWFNKNLIHEDKTCLGSYILNPNDVEKFPFIPLIRDGKKVLGKCINNTWCFTAFNEDIYRGSYIVSTNMKIKYRNYISILEIILDFYIYETSNHFLLITKCIGENGEFTQSVFALSKSKLTIESVLFVIRDTKDASYFVWKNERIKNYLRIKTVNDETFFDITSMQGDRTRIDFDDLRGKMTWSNNIKIPFYIDVNNDNVEHQKSYSLIPPKKK